MHKQIVWSVCASAQKPITCKISQQCHLVGHHGSFKIFKCKVFCRIEFESTESTSFLGPNLSFELSVWKLSVWKMTPWPLKHQTSVGWCDQRSFFYVEKNLDPIFFSPNFFFKNQEFKAGFNMKRRSINTQQKKRASFWDTLTCTWFECGTFFRSGSSIPIWWHEPNLWGHAMKKPNKKISPDPPVTRVPEARGACSPKQKLE